MKTADTAEKELWVSLPSPFPVKPVLIINYQTELLRLSEINFSEAFQVFVHLKVIRLFVESVLRYGLPANYIGIAVKVSASIRPFVHLDRISQKCPRVIARAQGHKTDAHGFTTTFFLPCRTLSGSDEVEGCRRGLKRGFRRGVPVTARSRVFRFRAVRDPVGCELNVALYFYRPFLIQ